MGPLEALFLIEMLYLFYEFNPLTLMDLLALPIGERVSLNGNRKTLIVKTLHENVRQQIEKKTVYMQLKPIRGANRLYSSQVIGFECIYAKRDFWPRESPNYNLEEMGLFKLLKG